MKRSAGLAILLAVALTATFVTETWAAGFQWGRTSPFEGAVLEVAIWYPSAAPPREETAGLFHQLVARDGAIQGDHLPLIVISHGTGGSSLSHFDTAAALADAGFVVVSVTHAGDNYKDGSASFEARTFSGRARQIGWVIDHMTGTWPGHGTVDPSRIGIFGHSAGAATTLILLGGELDMSRIVSFCRDNPDDWTCRNVRQRGVRNDGTPMIVAQDGRLKVAVVAAVAVAHGFTAESLALVKAPVQIWSAAADKIVSGSGSIGPRLTALHEDRLVPNAGHFAFLAPCPVELAARVPEICADPAGFDRPAFLREFQQTMIAFFREHL